LVFKKQKIITDRNTIAYKHESWYGYPESAWGPPSPLYNGYRVFPGGKAAMAWRWPSKPI